MDDDLLDRMTERGLARKPIDLDDAFEFGMAFRAFRFGSFRTLERAFNLKRRRRKKDAPNKIRDDLLRACAEKFFLNVSARAQARALAEALHRYQSSTWLADRNKTSIPPTYAGTAREFYFRICRSADLVPKQRRLFDILRTDPKRAVENSHLSLHAFSSLMETEAPKEDRRCFSKHRKRLLSPS